MAFRNEDEGGKEDLPLCMSEANIRVIGNSETTNGLYLFGVAENVSKPVLSTVTK